MQPFATSSLFAATCMSATSPTIHCDVLTVVGGGPPSEHIAVYASRSLTVHARLHPHGLLQVSARWASSSCASRTSSFSHSWPGVGRNRGRGRRQRGGVGQQHQPTINMNQWCTWWPDSVHCAVHRVQQGRQGLACWHGGTHACDAQRYNLETKVLSVRTLTLNCPPLFYRPAQVRRNAPRPCTHVVRRTSPVRPLHTVLHHV